MNMSVDEIKILAKLERDMDTGKQPFVVCDGQRWAFDYEILVPCGVKSGQTVFASLLTQLIKMNTDRIKIQRQLNNIYKSGKK